MYNDMFFKLTIGLAGYDSYNEYIDYILSKNTLHPSIMVYYGGRVGRLEYCEEAISMYPFSSYSYARDVLRDRFEMGEDMIMRNSIWSQPYIDHLKSMGLFGVVNELKVKYGYSIY